jgi:DNA-binding LacI/PurR family transcriptional regulator
MSVRATGDGNGMTRRPTAYDVAELAGVSQPTVSKALRNHPSINPETRQRIADAAKAIGYRVNKSAARLRSSKTHTLALIMLCHREDGRVQVSPFHLSLMGQVATAASESGHDLLVSFQAGDAAEFTDYHDSSLADGIMVIGSSEHRKAWDDVQQLAADGLNIVSWGGPTDGPGVISADNLTGGQTIAEHFLKLGRKNCAFIGSRPDGPRQFRERFEGFAETLCAAGAPVPPAFGGDGVDRVRQGYLATDELLRSGWHGDAIFAATDLMAIGVLQRLDEAGLRVPRDIAVAGFDGVDAGRYCKPALTTIEQDMAAAAGLLVNSVLAGDALTHAPQGHRSPVKLIVRASTVA